MPEPLPPILATPGLRLLEIGEDEKGAYLKFGATRRRVREVTVYLMTGVKVEWQYVYSMWDPTTRTVTTYRGKHGDPTKDRRINIQGA